MGREIRRVPPDWEHPTEKCRHSPWQGGCSYALTNGGRCFRPLYDKSFAEASAAWKQEFAAWEQGAHPDKGKYGAEEYWEYQNPPDRDRHRTRSWTPEEATAYQVYETVSEGTPVSPVLSSLEAVAQWLTTQGYTRSAAEAFAKSGWVMSGMMTGGKMYKDIESFDAPRPTPQED